MRQLLPRLDRSVSVVIFLLFNFCVASHGQDDKGRQPAGPAPAGGIAVGTTVVLKAPDMLLRGEDDDRPVSAGDGVSLEVKRVEGDRVLVAWTKGRYRGWVGVDQVVPLDQAMAHFDRAIERNTKDVDALRMRGRLWKARTEYDRALADFDQAIRLAPDRAQPMWIAAGCGSYGGIGITPSRISRKPSSSTRKTPPRTDSELIPGTRRVIRPRPSRISRKRSDSTRQMHGLTASEHMRGL